MPTIHPTAIVDDGARLEPDVEIGPYCTVGPDVELAAGVRLVSHAVATGRTRIGPGCVIHPFAVLGAEPQHLAHRGEPTRLEIGARNVIREHVTMHAGTAAGRGVTTVGSDGFFMAGAHVAHDCIVGDHVVFANNATLGGHVEVGDHVFMGGLSAAHQWSRIGRHAFVGGLAPVTRDVIPFALVGNDAHLEGINLVGLKRRGFSREAINDLRAAYRMLFAQEGTLQERVEDVAHIFAGSAEVQEVIAFVRADANRPLCLPRQ
jgi:UDP-N-acetylglucosamine acyltransferase